jgi:stearoyl-CoA desaturase (delta-9 desaturase)
VFLGGISDAYSYAKRHARHHRYSDTEFDNLQTTNHPWLTWWGYGTLKATPVDVSKMPISKKLENSPFHKFINQHYFVLYYLTLLTCFLIDVKLSFYVLVVGSTLAHQIGGIASIVTHRVGYRNFDTKDTSTNPIIWNLVFGIGGLHNNHHRFPYSYTTKLLSMESDPTAWIIKNVLAKSVVEPKI